VDRSADLVAAIDSPDTTPTLLILEFQTQHDPDKLEITLEEASLMRSRVRHGERRQDKYRVLTALIYLKGQCPESILDMTVSGGYGTRHAPFVWNLGQDSAVETLEALASGASWGLLFWVPLMAGAEDMTVIARWNELAPNLPMLENLVAIALIFAELVGRRIPWAEGVRTMEMTESEVVNDWIRQGMAQGQLATWRETLVEILEARFPSDMNSEIAGWIQQQDSIVMLRDWHKAALRAANWE
jgi:hypothetical protein